MRKSFFFNGFHAIYFKYWIDFYFLEETLFIEIGFFCQKFTAIMSYDFEKNFRKHF